MCVVSGSTAGLSCPEAVQVVQLIQIIKSDRIRVTELYCHCAKTVKQDLLSNTSENTIHTCAHTLPDICTHIREVKKKSKKHSKSTGGMKTTDDTVSNIHTSFQTADFIPVGRLIAICDQTVVSYANLINVFEGVWQCSHMCGGSRAKGSAHVLGVHRC